MNSIQRFFYPGKALMCLMPMAGKMSVLLGLMLSSMFLLVCLGPVWSSIALALQLYLATSFYLNFKNDMHLLQQAMERTAVGNLREKIVVHGKDEMAILTGKLQLLVGNLSAMVASISSNSALVAHAGRSLTSGNQDLSDRTEQQAANLEQTSASLHELSSTVQENVQATQKASSQAASVRDIAEVGAKNMAVAVQSVEAIQSSAQRMNEIIGVIDGLAFQTNILALNAAVEAARAGEAGRGFAVVASEVRTLAQRSAESAKEIRQLISTSSKLVSSSVIEIRSAGTNISEIASGIRSVAESMSHISNSSVEQSSTLAEISNAVRQLDEITQQNGQMVERSVAQTRGLEERASTLAQAVSAFQLQQGTADEALEMVDKALTYRQQSTREGFLRGLTEAHMGFFDRDMYAFVIDQNGTYLAFGGNKAKVGTRVQDIAGINGQQMIDAIATQASNEPGWVEYDITNPATGTVQTKMSFVQKLDNAYLGCGIYKNLAAA